MVTDICLKYILSYRIYASWYGCVIISCFALYDCPVLEMVSLLFLELYQLLQYSYVCSSVMFVHPEGGCSARDTRVSLTSVDMVSRLARDTRVSLTSVDMVSRLAKS